MWLRDYLIGVPVEFHLPLLPAECCRRLERELGSVFWPFHANRMVGSAGSDWVHIEYRRSPFSFNGRPLLLGTMTSEKTGAHFKGTFVAPITARLFLAIWYGFVSFVGVGMLVAKASPNSTPWYATLGIFLLFASMPLVMIAIGTVGSDDDLDRIVRFVEDVCRSGLARAED